MYAQLIRYTDRAETIAGMAAAVCTRSDAPERALRGAMAGGHESVLEHAVFTFMIGGVSRTLLAQLTRHRIASYSVESQRYCSMEEMPVVVPESVLRDSEVFAKWAETMQGIRDFYRFAVERGVPLEDARYATPQAACTNLMLTMNARELRHFFSLRCCNRAQWEIRELADRMLAECQRVAPELFRTAGPGCVRGECPEARPCGHPRSQR